MKKSLLVIIILMNGISNGQYPFEKYPAINYQKKGSWTVYDRRDKENKMHWTMSLPKFFNEKDSLTIQLTAFGDSDTSFIRLFKNKDQIQLIKEPFDIGRLFGMLHDTVSYGDINGDSLPDVKILCWYGGVGIAGLNERVIYLFQRPDGKFTKISYLDMSASERPERDFDGDGNYEIITMSLQNYEDHNFWTFNLFNFMDGDLVNVDNRHDYPIMIQYLYRENYEITNRISRVKMRSFSVEKPEYFDKN